MENWNISKQVTGNERISGAWLGLFAADLMSTGVNPEHPISEQALSIQAQEALVIIETLSQGKEIEFPIHKTSADALLNQQHFDSQQNFNGLLQVLALTLWVRAKDNSSFRHLARDFLSHSATPETFQPAIIALCFLTRETFRRGDAIDVWRKFLGSWKRLLLEEFSDIESEESNPPIADELAWDSISGILRAVDGALSHEGLQHFFESPIHGNPIHSAAGFIYGLNNGSIALSEQWQNALLGIPRIASTLDALLTRLQTYPNLSMNPDITSDNAPLPVVFMPCRKGTLCLTAAPGVQNTMIGTEFGMRRVKRDMSVDINRVRETGARFLVCIMKTDEIVQSEMTSLGAECETQGLEWVLLPPAGKHESKDYFIRDVTDVTPRLISILDDGGTVAVCGSDFGSWSESSFVILLSALDPEANQGSINAKLEDAVQLGIEQFSDSVHDFMLR